jgi:hypothetical protein
MLAIPLHKQTTAMIIAVIMLIGMAYFGSELYPTMAEYFATNDGIMWDRAPLSNHQRGQRMNKLLITLLLKSPFSFADWGDVYYCDMTTHSSIARSGKQYQLALGRFTFKLDKTKNAMVFGKEKFFSHDQQLISDGRWPSKEK